MAVAAETSSVQRSERRGVPGKALFVGSLCAIVVNLVAPYSEWIVRSTLMTTNYFPLGLAFTFLIVVCVLNPLLKWTRPGAGLSEGDLGVIYMMLLAAVSVPTYGITGYVISVSASAFYFATPENGWADFLHEHIPSWIVPEPGPKTDWFFEGLPPGESVPWEIWVVPLFWWGTLIVATLALSTSLIALFRSQWIDNERLSFPLVDVPNAMIEGSSRGRMMPAFLGTKLFWWGFGTSFLKVAWEIPSYFYPQWPTFGRIRFRIKRGKIFPGISSILTLPLLGISYFVNTDVLLSVWVFNLLNTAEISLFNRIGFTIGAAEIYSVSPPSLAWQGFGAFSALVFGGVWVAREHLSRVWRKAWTGDPTIDDSHEVMSYRACVVTVVASIAFILLWLHVVGITLSVSLLLFYAVITLYLGLTRIVVEGGLVFVRGPLLPQAFAMHTIGPGSLGPRTMTGLALSYAWACDPIANFMPFGANAIRIHTDRGLPRSTYLTNDGTRIGDQSLRIVLVQPETGLCDGWIQFRRVGVQPRRAGSVRYDRHKNQSRTGHPAVVLRVLRRRGSGNHTVDLAPSPLPVVATPSPRVLDRVGGPGTVDDVYPVHSVGDQVDHSPCRRFDALQSRETLFHWAHSGSLRRSGSVVLRRRVLVPRRRAQSLLLGGAYGHTGHPEQREGSLRIPDPVCSDIWADSEMPPPVRRARLVPLSSIANYDREIK